MEERFLAALNSCMLGRSGSGGTTKAQDSPKGADLQPGNYSLILVGYRDTEPAGLVGREGRRGWIKRSDFYNRWGFPLYLPGLAKPPCQHKRRFTGS